MVFLYITCRNLDEAKNIGRALIEQKAAGWINVSPVASIYRDGGGLQEVDGAALFVKTIESKIQAVEDITRKMHSHSVPCIASLSLYRLNREYKDWLINRVA